MSKLINNIILNKDEIYIGGIIIKAEDIKIFLGKSVKIILILIFMYISIKIGSAIISKFVEKQKKLRFSLDEKKAKTLGEVLKSILRYAVYSFGAISILAQFGTLSLTFAGIGGVALGFGAQSLIKDVINGFFILIEDQFSVGDFINIDDKGGIVESIELRITRIRDFNGDLHIIPNGSINKVTNHSRGDARVLVEIDIDNEEDIDNVMTIINQVCDRFKKDNEDIIEGPRVLGIGALKENGVTIKVVGKAKSLKHWDCEMKLRKEIKQALDKADVKYPYARRKILKDE